MTSPPKIADSDVGIKNVDSPWTDRFTGVTTCAAALDGLSCGSLVPADKVCDCATIQSRSLV